jgi:hypothetical protein
LGGVQVGHVGRQDQPCRLTRTSSCPAK